MDFLDFAFGPSVWPFAASLSLFFLITVIEIIAVFTGMGAHFGMDADVDVPDASAHLHVLDTGGFFHHVFDWLGMGRVPYLVSLAAFLFCFGITGLYAQNALIQSTGAPLAWPLVAAGCGAAGLLLVSLFNRLLGRIWPKDVETSVVHQDALVGCWGVVAMGSVGRENPGQVKIRDHQGTMHHVLAYTDGEETFETGTPVVLTERRGSTFFVIRHPMVDGEVLPENLPKAVRQRPRESESD